MGKTRFSNTLRLFSIIINDGNRDTEIVNIKHKSIDHRINKIILGENEIEMTTNQRFQIYYIQVNFVSGFEETLSSIVSSRNELFRKNSKEDKIQDKKSGDKKMTRKQSIILKLKHRPVLLYNENGVQ